MYLLEAYFMQIIQLKPGGMSFVFPSYSFPGSTLNKISPEPWP